MNESTTTRSERPALVAPGHELLCPELVTSLEAWLDDQLEALERKFAHFATPASPRSSKGPNA